MNNKTVITHRWYANRQAKRTYKLLEFSKLLGYKINRHKSITFLCTSNKQVAIVIFNSMFFTKNKYHLCQGLNLQLMCSIFVEKVIKQY